MVQRVTYRRRRTYKNRNNMKKIVKTPGGRLALHHIKKRGTLPKCGQCKDNLKGIKPSRPASRMRMSHRMKTVTRAYGGSRCHNCVKANIIRAFINQEASLMRKLKRLSQQKI